MPTPQRYVTTKGDVTWRVRFRHRGRSTSETFTTERDALTFCADIQHRGTDQAVRILEHSLTTSTAPTLDELFTEWIDRNARRVRSDRTVADNRRDWEKWVSPALGHRRVDTVTVADVQEWIDWMEAGDPKRGIKPLAPKTIGDRHALLHGVFLWAASPARKGGPVITSDPCAGTILPRKHRGAVKGMMPAEWAALHSALRQINPDAADLALFMVGTGWRWSEATALSAAQVEDDGRQVHASTGWVIRRNADGVHERVADTKTRSSRRRTVLDDELAAMVRRRMVGLRPGDLVFRTTTGKQWHYSNFRRDAWDPALATSGLGRRVTPHALRHTHAGWLLMSGAASLADVRARLGHASIATTVEIYGGLVQDAPVAAVDAVASMRRGVTAEAPPVITGDVVRAIDRR